MWRGVTKEGYRRDPRSLGEVTADVPARYECHFTHKGTFRWLLMPPISLHRRMRLFLSYNILNVQQNLIL